MLLHLKGNILGVATFKEIVGVCLPNDTLAGTAPWSNQKDTQETMTNMQQGM